jgi:hypothetical protein
MDLTKELVSDVNLQTIYKSLNSVAGAKMADDLTEVIKHFGGDHMATMLRVVGNNTQHLDEFAQGMNAMATVLRKHADGSAAAWQNVDLLAELKANPGDAADLIRQIGRVSKKVEDSAIKFGKQTANQYDVSRAIATSIGRVTDTAGNGYSLVANLAQLKQLTNDMETLVNVPAAGQLRKSIALIRRLRSDAVKTALGGQ